jgi:hypothetical protein
VDLIIQGDETAAERWLYSHLEEVRLGIRSLAADEGESAASTVDRAD